MVAIEALGDVAEPLVAAAEHVHEEFGDAGEVVVEVEEEEGVYLVCVYNMIYMIYTTYITYQIHAICNMCYTCYIYYILCLVYGITRAR